MPLLRDLGGSRPIRFLMLAALFASNPFVAIYYLAAITDPDIWWQMKVGEFIVGHRSFPHTAIFSQAEPTTAWYAYSWGFEILVAGAHAALGLRGLMLFLFLAQ